MHTQLLRNLVLMLLMLAAVALAPQLRATISMADQRPPIDLEAMVPRQLGEWREQTGMAAQLVNPEAQTLVNQLYRATLARAYVNRDGYRVMLSIAYGNDQSDALQLHKPEVCYPAQGFEIKAKERVTLLLPDRSISATRLATQLGQRLEPLTYWIVLGDQITRGGLDKKLKEMRYSLLEYTLPDGMLVRVSSIDGDTAHAYEMQAEFAVALLGAISPERRNRFFGSTASH